jgi:hypothetical protein
MSVNLSSTIEVQKHDKQRAMARMQVKKGVATTLNTQQKLEELSGGGGGVMFNEIKHGDKEQYGVGLKMIKD